AADGFLHSVGVRWLCHLFPGTLPHALAQHRHVVLLQRGTLSCLSRSARTEPAGGQRLRHLRTGYELPTRGNYHVRLLLARFGCAAVCARNQGPASARVTTRGVDE